MARKRRKSRKKKWKPHLFSLAKPYGSLAYERGKKVLPEIEVEITTASSKLANKLVGLARKQGAKVDLELEWA